MEVTMLKPDTAINAAHKTRYQRYWFSDIFFFFGFVRVCASVCVCARKRVPTIFSVAIPYFSASSLFLRF